MRGRGAHRELPSCARAKSYAPTVNNTPNTAERIRHVDSLDPSRSCEIDAGLEALSRKPIELLLFGEHDREIAQTRRVGRRRRCADAEPNVGSDVMVIPAGAHEERTEFFAHHRDAEAERSVVKLLRRAEVCDVKVDVADHGVGVQAFPW